MSNLKRFLHKASGGKSLRDFTPENYWGAMRAPIPGNEFVDQNESEALGRAVSDRYGTENFWALADKLSPDIGPRTRLELHPMADRKGKDFLEGKHTRKTVGDHLIEVNSELNPWQQLGSLYHEVQHGAEQSQGTNPRSHADGAEDLPTMDREVRGHYARHRNLDYDFPLGELSRQQVLMGQEISPSMRERVKDDLPLNEKALPLRNTPELGSIDEILLKLLGESK